MKISRRLVLRGIGGAALALPLLESFPLSRARAAGPAASTGSSNTSFAVFFRQANGVACEQNSQLGTTEPERFWPTATGALTTTTLADRALAELVDYKDRLLVIGGVNMTDYNFGDGHARGALQGLTGRGPTVQGVAGDSEAAGMSLDHRIGQDLNPSGHESLFLYAGENDGWLGGACISYRGSAQRRAPYVNPKSAYDAISGGAASAMNSGSSQLGTRQKSINDVLRSQLKRLLGMPALSKSDHARLQLHFDSVRELEVSLACQLDQAAAQRLDGAQSLTDATDGDLIWQATKLHMDVAAMAIACGHTRSVAIQIGNGNDGSSRYRDSSTGALMENYHYISHRRASHDASGAPIANADLMHHDIDRQFARAFKYLLDRLSSYSMPDGKPLLDHGIAVWYNDLGNGPDHSAQSTPVVVAGSGSGYLKQGQYIKLPGGQPNHNQVLNTLGAAVGIKNASGGALNDFGDPNQPQGLRSELIA